MVAADAGASTAKMGERPSSVPMMISLAEERSLPCGPHGASAAGASLLNSITKTSCCCCCVASFVEERIAGQPPAVSAKKTSSGKSLRPPSSVSVLRKLCMCIAILPRVGVWRCRGRPRWGFLRTRGKFSSQRNFLCPIPSRSHPTAGAFTTPDATCMRPCDREVNRGRALRAPQARWTLLSPICTPAPLPTGLRRSHRRQRTDTCDNAPTMLPTRSPSLTPRLTAAAS